MATAVIGAGNIGKTLTGLLSKAGEPVAIAASRVPTEIAVQLGGSVTAAAVADAIDYSEAAIFAVWRRSTGEVRRHGGVGLIDP